MKILKMTYPLTGRLLNRSSTTTNEAIESYKYLTGSRIIVNESSSSLQDRLAEAKVGTGVGSLGDEVHRRKYEQTHVAHPVNGDAAIV